MRRTMLTLSLAMVVLAGGGSLGARRAANTVIVMDTAKGVIEIELFDADAPKSVAQIVELTKKSFYRGQRIHRVEKGLVQFGDPTSRDVSKKGYWGSGGSGHPIGVAEFSKKHLNIRGAVGLAHSGTPQYADSQLYILKAPSPSLDGKHVIVGQVTKGMEVVDKLAVMDVIKNFSVK
jgi:cyclophilin family peptidyl-prolyl cis-trans isomerase